MKNYLKSLTFDVDVALYLDELEGRRPSIPVLKKVYYYISFFKDVIKSYAMSFVCKYRGHDIVDDGSYSGPDSGVENLRCKRCGQTWTHVLY